MPPDGTNDARDGTGSTGPALESTYHSAVNPSGFFTDHTHLINAQGGHETRPINAAVNYIIKL